MSTLYVSRIVGSSPEADTRPVLTVDCVTVHPDAGLPPTPADETTFLGLLLRDAHPYVHGQGEVEDFLAVADTPVPIETARRTALVDIAFDDAFWAAHRDRWWAAEDVINGRSLREWLVEPSDNAPYQVATYEVLTAPGALEGVAAGVFRSAAHW